MDDALIRLRTALADRYAVERQAGSGAMAMVFLADDLKHHRQVAIKVLRPELAATLGAQRFLREIAIEAQLNHPNILPLHDSGQAAGFVYYVMPFVEGESLRDRLAREGVLPIHDAVRLLHDIAEALSCAHAHGVVHRDIKPDNVMVSGRHAVVTDFGIAKAVSAAAASGGDGFATTTGIALGTPRYMAPEQCLADPATDHRADIYALGVMAFELLTGRPPFTEATPQAMAGAHVSARPPHVRDLRREVPPALDAIISRCLAKKPEDRFQSAEALITALEALRMPLPAPVRRRRLVVGATATMLLLVAAGWLITAVRQRTQRQWTLTVATPQLSALVDSGKTEEAFALAQRARRIAPGDTTIESLWRQVSRVVDIHSDPPDARAYRRALRGSDSAWHALGVTPLNRVTVPGGGWHLRLVHDGFAPLEALATFAIPDSLSFTLVAEHGPYAGMVRIPSASYPDLWLPGLEAVGPFSVRGYWIDAREVTNRQFKTFVDSGGYRRREYWQELLSANGRQVSWEATMARFTDRTGRPGPATWEAGSYPPGEADFPVAGVSWYEAAAYSRFVGKSLPTIYHWVRAARPWDATWIAAAGNFSRRGPVAVGTSRAIGPFGTSDMAGNVREWCLNASGDSRYILGGGWNDQDYDFAHPITQQPMDRSVTNGLRLARFDAGDSSLAVLSRAVPRTYPDYSRTRPVSGAVFDIYRRLYEYDASPLRAQLIAREDSADYVHETVSFAAPYGNERILAHLFLPQRGRPPLQTVVYFPGAGALTNRAFSLAMFGNQIDYLVRSGRIVVYPIYKSTYERGDDFTRSVPHPSSDYRDHVIMWVKDFRRTIDYLMTRQDVDTARLGYFGYSWGGYMGAIIAALEPRLRAQVLYIAGLPYQQGRPEVNPLNFAPRATIPTLLMNGQYDPYFPLETSIQPFYRLLGTPNAHKRSVVGEGVHALPRSLMIAEALAWFDQYLGPVTYPTAGEGSTRSTPPPGRRTTTP